MFCAKLFILFAAVLPSLAGNLLDIRAGSNVTDIDSDSDSDSYLFENDIVAFLEKIRAILKNGDPEQNIPPLEPLPVPYYEFHFILEDSRLEGSIGPLFVRNMSDFIITNVKFDVLQFKLTLALRFPTLAIDGEYQLKGNIFEEQVNGRGTFLSNTTDLDLEVMVHIASNLNRTLIKELTLDFSFSNDDIIFTNSVGGGATSGHFDNGFLQPLLYRIRGEYVPLLLNTISLVGSDIVHDVTLDDLLKFILGIIQGGGLQLIAN